MYEYSSIGNKLPKIVFHLYEYGLILYAYVSYYSVYVRLSMYYIRLYKIKKIRAIHDVIRETKRLNLLFIIIL